MSTVMLRCDGDCGGATRQGKPGQTIDELRAALATVGWRSSTAQNTDLCSLCVRRAETALAWAEDQK